MNKKGSMFDILAWIIIGVIVILFLGTWMYAHNILTSNLVNLPSIQLGTTSVNMSTIADQTFGEINRAEQTWLPIIAFLIILTEGLAILITNFFIKEHPLMFIPYIFVIGVGVVVSVYISNFYQGLLTGGYAFSPYLVNMTMADYILIYLPYWTAIIGAFGAIFLMANIIIDSGGNA